MCTEIAALRTEAHLFNINVRENRHEHGRCVSTSYAYIYELNEWKKTQHSNLRKRKRTCSFRCLSFESRNRNLIYAMYSCNDHLKALIEIVGEAGKCNGIQGEPKQ